MSKVSRRGVLAGAAGGVAFAGTAAASGTFGNPDQPPQGAANTTGPASARNPGPQNAALSEQFPAVNSPFPTDVGDMPLCWASFNNAPRRIQQGGWARQVTEADFEIATEISGVNMRLASGGVRELHWHQAAEWGFVTNGSCRVTVIDPEGRAYVADTGVGDLWYFPAGYPHALQGLGPDGCEFLLAFDNGKQSEYNTLLVTDWIAHTPPDVLALNFGVPAETFAKMATHDLWIFQGPEPGTLADARSSFANDKGAPPNPFTYPLGSGPVTRQSSGGTVRIADSHNFKASTTVAAALVTVHPGGMREMHWHPNADEWQYYIAGSAQMTVFNTGPAAVTNNFHPGDVGYIKRNLGHYIKNTGNTDLVFLEIFRANSYQDVSLSDWLTHTPSALVAAHFNVPEADIAKWPRDTPVVVPA
jgi:oxalate decarboxylase